MTSGSDVVKGLGGLGATSRRVVFEPDSPRDMAN